MSEKGKDRRGTDLGGSSKHANESLEDRSGAMQPTMIVRQEE